MVTGEDDQSRQLRLQSLVDVRAAVMEHDFVDLGYKPDEIAFAMLAVALARIKMLDANLDTDEAIARAIRSIERGE